MPTVHDELLISQLIQDNYKTYEDSILYYTLANRLKQFLFNVYKKMNGYTILYIQLAMEKKTM